MSEHVLRIGLSFEQIKQKLIDIDFYHNPKYKKRDDISLSQLYADVFKDVSRFNTTTNEWSFYNGCVWKDDTRGVVAEDLIKKLSRALSIYGFQYFDNDSQFKKMVDSFASYKKRKDILKDSRSFNYFSAEDLDKDDNLFNCKNGVINLTTYELIPHSPDLLLSKCSNVVFNPEIKSSEFDKFINEIMLGDKEKIDYLQKVFGYTLCGTNHLEQCYFLYGSTTRNGKSTLLGTMRYMFGDYGVSSQPEILAKKDKDSSKASPDVARLFGCRFLNLSEPPKHMRLDSSTLKSWSGNDQIHARFLYQEDFEFVAKFVVFINTNYLPVITDTTIFDSGRLNIIEFAKHFTIDEQDTKLKAKLTSKDNISGIFNWCIEGLKEFRNSGEKIIPPQSVVKATKEYRDSSDKIQNFINDCLSKFEGNNLKAQTVYEAFANWCKANGFGVENYKNWLEDMRAKNMVADSGRVNGVGVRNIIKGYVLSDEYTGSQINF